MDGEQHSPALLHGLQAHSGVSSDRDLEFRTSHLSRLRKLLGLPVPQLRQNVRFRFQEVAIRGRFLWFRVPLTCSLFFNLSQEVMVIWGVSEVTNGER